MTIPTKLYIITCTKNGKMYAGVTSRDLALRWKEHVKSFNGQQPASVIHMAMRKHGLDAFTIETMYEFASPEEAAHAEIQVIANLNLMRDGYNAGPGGDLSPTLGVGHTLEARAKISAKGREYYQRPGVTQALSARSKAYMADPANRERIAEALRGRPLGEEHRKKIGAAHLGSKRSPETRANIAAAKTGRKRPDVALRCAGVSRSAEDRAAMSVGRLVAAQRRLDLSVMSHYA